ncbi:MAG: M10 family metallopeptidase C-terminal domain-containing protein [Rhizobiales bacterium]|nr:M10 family metallopeptidase C-terminal domain-containing protein [Hyphomicrobiales bacterium]MBI3673660.1 M10 family metallopeptidase C-terminal domain-containing protein [Hyphomicrobiales bacterium]
MAEATAREQLLLELINRARMDPAGEAKRYGIDLNQGLAAGTIAASPKQVLAFNPLLNAAADAHSQWMLDTDTFSHTGAGGSSPGGRMTSAGYVFSGSWTWGENIVWNGSTGAIDGDKQVVYHHQMLFLSAGHRENILNGTFREVGLGSLTGPFTSGGTTYNSLMTTEDFAKSGTTVFVTGVNYTDTDADKFYSIGEGAGGRTVSLLQNSSVIGTASTGTVGGYALGTLATGNVEVQFSGGGLAATMGAAIALAGSNVKIDLVNGNTIFSNVTTTLTQSSLGLRLIGIDNVNGQGNTFANTLTGNSGNNALIGAGGNDILSGGLGNDKLIGGAGNDTLTGGGGADRFIYKAVTDSRAAGDTIADYQDGIDRIDLSRIDAITGGTDDAFHFTAGGGTGTFTSSAGELRLQVSPTQTIVEADVNGDGIADLHLSLTGSHALTAIDFIL